MKNAWKQTLAIVLCALMLVTVVAGCQPSEDTPDGTTTKSTTTTTDNGGDVTDPSGDVTDPSGDVTDPSGDVTDPSGDVTDPSGDVTDPSGDVTDPSGDVTDPSGDVTDPTDTDKTTTNNGGGNKTTTSNGGGNKTTTNNGGGNKTTASTGKTTTKTNATSTNKTTKPVGGDSIQVGNVTVNKTGHPYISGGTMEINMMLPWTTDNANMSKQAFTKYYEEYSGIKINYQYYQYSEIFVLKSTMLNSGSIPDIFLGVGVAFKCSDVKKYGEQGFFTDLTDKVATWAPTVNGLLNSKDYAYMKKVAYAPGKLYALPILYNAENYKNRDRLEEFQPMINTLWLDELGLDIPKTTEEFYEVCKAFTEEDPDGNGKNDTFGYGAPIFSPQIWNPWGLGMSWYTHGAISEKGEVVSGTLTDNFREGCRFYNRMWEEGLMCKQMFGASEAAKKALIAKTGIVSCSYISSYLSDSELKNWTCIAWPKAPNTGDFKAGVAYLAYRPGDENVIFIGKGAKSPEACLRWLDYFYTPDGAMLWQYGPEGKAYTKIGNSYKLRKNAWEEGSDQRIICSYSLRSPINVLDQNSSEMTVREQFGSRIQKEAKAVNITATYNFYTLDVLATEADRKQLEKIKTPGDWNWGVQAIRGDYDIETDWNSYKNQYTSDYAKWKAVYQGIFDRNFK